MEGIRKLLSNKNTVTIIGVIAMILVLYIGYNARIRQATSPQSVPYAVSKITAGEQITSEKIGLMDVPVSMLKGDIITSREEVLDKYANADSVIPTGSLFYRDAVVEQEQLPNAIIYNIAKGYKLTRVAVNMETTFANSIYVGDYIELYFNGRNPSNNQPIHEKLYGNVKVLAVKDSSGQNVFANTDDNRTPAMLIFALPEANCSVYDAISQMSGWNANITLKPTSEGLKTNPGELTVNKTVENLIKSHVTLS